MRTSSRSSRSRSATNGLQLPLFAERLPFASALPFEPLPAPTIYRPPIGDVFPNYAEYLNSDRWDQLVAATLHRDGHRCRACDRDRDLQVHHRRYPDVLGTETVDDLTTFCRGCHVVIEWFRMGDRRARMAAQRRR